MRDLAERLDGLLHLPKIDPAAEAHAQMQVKANPFAPRQRAIEIVGDDLDEFLARHPAGEIIQDVDFNVFAGHALLSPPKYCSSARRTRDRAR